MTPPRRRRGIAILVVVGLAGGRGVAARSVDGEEPPVVPAVEPSAARTTKLFPLPLYAISPAEGSTYGVLPVFMQVDGTGRTTSIAAPSVSWNHAAGVNGTIRYYDLGHETRRWWFILAASTNVNRSFRFEYRDVPGRPRRSTLEIQAVARRSLFYRYFGQGPDTTKQGESTYTRALALLSARGGLNLVRRLNVGVRGGVRWDQPQRGGVSGLPKTQLVYPGAPGLDGAALATAELSVRFDTRLQGDYGDAGLASELHAARDFGLARTDSFWRLTWHTRALWRETSFLTGAARVYWTEAFVDTNVTPFYYQSSLGGDTLFRGFTEDRFIDRAAWEAEFEQRFRLFQTSWFGVVTDWRVDPFVAVGQVFSDYRNIVSRVQTAGGLGFRAFVRPNIIGRADVAYSTDGFRAYVLMGYPY